MKRELWIAGAVVGGAVAGGLAATPSGENQDAHALLWGGIAGVTAAIIANHAVKDAPTDDQLKRDLELFQNGKTVLEQEGTGVFTDRQGQKVLSGQKAHWKIHSTDRWVKQGSTHLDHVDHEVEITPFDERGSSPSASRP